MKDIEQGHLPAGGREELEEQEKTAELVTPPSSSQRTTRKNRCIINKEEGLEV